MTIISPQEAVEKYKFYHILKLTDELETPGNPGFVPAQKCVTKQLEKLDLAGTRVLDIGCRDGLFCFQAEQMGCGDVVGIDNDISKPAIEFLIPYYKSNVKMHELNVYDLTPEQFGLFDVVIFPGVLYHLRYPFYALKVVRDVMKEGATLILETSVWRGDERHAMLFCPIGDESPYEATSCTFFNGKGLSDSLTSMNLRVETVEYVSDQGKSRTLTNKVKRVVRERWSGITGLSREKKVERAVFVCKAVRDNRESLMPGFALNEYWEQTHQYHTESGGQGRKSA